MPHPRQALLRAVRRPLRGALRRWRWARRLAEVGRREFDLALDDVYGSAYYGDHRDPASRDGLSGYERYDRDSSNANIAAYLLWRFFPATTALDVGCATGFVVEGLRELGVDARGVDVSTWAIDHPGVGARGHIFQADVLKGLPFDDAEFDLVSVLETLEHLPPGSIPAALGEVRRVTRRWVVATIPSFGANPHGPGGWFDGKVRDDRLDHYRTLGPDYQGPIAYDDLARDATGEPVEGHLTIASFSWWTRRFEDAGFRRAGAVERRIHPELARFGLTKYWNLYVMEVPGAGEPPERVRTAEEIIAAEQRYGLDRRPPDLEDMEIVERFLAASEG